MEQRRKYRRFLLWCIALDLLLTGWLGYQYFDRKIPDEIQVVKGQEQQVQDLLEHPLLTFEDSITVSGKGSYQLQCSLLGVIPLKEIKVTPADSSSVFVSGSTVGIYMETEGVLIIDTGQIVSEDGIEQEPAKNIVKPGDYIVAFNEEKISTKKELIEDLSQLDGGDVTLDIKRNGEIIPVSLTPVKDIEGSYKLGIWVRDDTQGIGTLTFVDSEGRYGALGHGINDVDTGELLDINEGILYQAEILDIQKGSKGTPGELSGMIRYESARVIGTITRNGKNGIYGYFSGDESAAFLENLPIAYKQDVEIGPAVIRSCVSGEVEEYKAEITKIDMNHEDSNKSFVIHVTDEDLLELTGGIVQGMSGSPIIQDGKIIGAVTHVLVNDPTRGYGIFIENMLDMAE